MLKTAICDDNLLFSRQMEERLKKEKLVESVTLFESPDALQEAMRQGQSFDVVFMDIDFQQRQAGLQAASSIYQQDPLTQIIYITGYNDLYSQQVLLFETNLTGYITKPVQEDVLSRYLKKADDKKSQQNQYLTISIKGKDYSLLMDQIETLESSKHKIRIQTTGDVYTVYDKLSNILPKLSSDFIQCHKSFIVNARHIERFSSDEIFMKNQEESVPISRAYKKQTKDAFFRYINEKSRNG